MSELHSHPTIAEEVLRAVRAVLGTSGTMIPLHEPEFAGREWEYVKECIDTGWVSSVGSYVDRFERDLAAFTGAQCAIATANGTAALHVCMLLAGVQQGEEVLVPALTFIATANAVSYCGAIPHFVDSESETLGIDAGKLEARLAEVAEVVDGRCINHATGRTIRALVVMHAFGHPADLDALAAVCERWHLVLIEDAAESLGSYYQGRHTGNVGRVAALSFNGNKVMTTGGGGAILTNDPELGRRAKHLTTTARVPHRWNFVHDEIGYNYRLPNLNAALGCAQLERVPGMIARKRELASRYASAFIDTPGVRFLREPEGSRSNYWLNTIVLDPGYADALEMVLKALNDANYMSRPVWTLMHKLPMYADCPRADLGSAEQLSRAVINLPSSPALAD
ncbi:LegC family aminotransferase [Sphingomonas sp. MMS24-J13]|uniref:LegC family aminotransferase n=1 Tax=Sphingomonas sp. MMS24-J13 TaxID=3238686 RepID=UPI00384A4826